MKTFLRTLALVAFGAVMFYGIGIAVAGAGAPAAGKPCPGCPMATADNAAGAGMEKMQAHLDGMKSAVAGLRESEKKLEATDDPKAFRAAVLEHLKKLDDLQAAHLTHMESMMGRMHGGMPGMRHGECPDCKCNDCRCKECKCGNCSHKGDCSCHCGCCGEKSGHTH